MFPAASEWSRTIQGFRKEEGASIRKGIKDMKNLEEGEAARIGGNDMKDLVFLESCSQHGIQNALPPQPVFRHPCVEPLHGPPR